MKILVPIKRVPDYEIKIKPSSSGTEISKDNISKYIINPFDEIAVEEALRIKEAIGESVEVVVVSIAVPAATEQLRTALAMGADRAVLVLAEEAIDSYLAAKVLASLYQKDNYNLVIMGKQAIDSDASQTGPLLAASLGLPQATFASKVVIDTSLSFATVTREVDGGLETVKVSLPAVITTDLRLNEPRYTSLPGIVKAKKKPLEEIKITDLGIDLSPKTKILRVSLPSTRKAGVKVSSVTELVEKLRVEAKVI